eukprot:406686_1
MIRDSISGRRIRARRRAMGLRLFSSLFEHTTSKVLHEEVAGLLAAAIKECKLQRVLDIEEQERRNHFRAKQEEMLQMTDEEKEAFEKKADELDKWEQMKDLDQFETMWDEAGDFGGDAILHYSRGIEGVGALHTLTQSAFHHLYTAMTAIFYKEFLSQEKVQLDAGILGFLDSWSLHFNEEDHAFLHDSKIFQVIKVLMSNAYISGSTAENELEEEEETDVKEEDDNEIVIVEPSDMDPRERERTPKPMAVVPVAADTRHDDAGMGVHELLSPPNAGLPGHTPEPTPDSQQSPNQFSPEPSPLMLDLSKKEEEEDSPGPQKLLFDDEDSSDKEEGVGDTAYEDDEGKAEGKQNTNQLLESLLMKKLQDMESAAGEGRDEDPVDHVRILQPKNLNEECEIKASTAQHRVPQIIDYNTGTFWQTAVNADNDQFSYNKVKKAHWLQIEFKEDTAVREIAWYLDGERDKEFLP